MTNNLTYARLREALDYDPATGIFRWRFRPAKGSRRRVGDAAGGPRSGYWYIAIDGVDQIASRLAFLYVTGAWPRTKVGFRNGDGTDLRYDNLFERPTAIGSFDHKSRDSRNAYNRAHRQQNPDVYRASDLRKTFGIDLAEYQRLFVEQKGVCAICEKPETEKRLGKTRWLGVDHDHTTGAVRGLLCQSCNKAVGLLQDSPAVARAAAVYLEKHAPAENVVPLRPKEAS